MRKVNVSIEETLCKTITLEVPDDVNDIFEWAEETATEMYENGEIVLTADDFNGQRLMMIKDEDDNETEWKDF